LGFDPRTSVGSAYPEYIYIPVPCVLDPLKPSLLTVPLLAERRESCRHHGVAAIAWSSACDGGVSAALDGVAQQGARKLAHLAGVHGLSPSCIRPGMVLWSFSSNIAGSHRSGGHLDLWYVVLLCYPCTRVAKTPSCCRCWAPDPCAMGACVLIAIGWLRRRASMSS
jgi:hypothetical protein